MKMSFSFVMSWSTQQLAEQGLQNIISTLKEMSATPSQEFVLNAPFNVGNCNVTTEAKYLINPDNPELYEFGWIITLQSHDYPMVIASGQRIAANIIAHAMKLDDIISEFFRIHEQLITPEMHLMKDAFLYSNLQ